MSRDKQNDLEKLLARVDRFKKDNKADLSSGEDLSIAVMNLISIEEHLFFTSQKTGKKEYLDLLNEVRLLRTELMKDLIPEYEGELWCISKHLLAASMRVMEVGIKELKKGNEKKANNLFEKSYKLYSLFWGTVLGMEKPESKGGLDKADVNYLGEKEGKAATMSVFSKLGSLVQKAIDCCRE